MNTATTSPDLHAYTAMSITDLWAERKRLIADLANGQIDRATHDERRQVVRLALQIRADEWEITTTQQRLAENRQRLAVLVPPIISPEALFVLLFLAGRESKGEPEFLMGFSSQQRQTIEAQLVKPGYVEMLEGRWEPDIEQFGKFYIATPAGLAFFKDK
jgi:hypothetical protein